MKTVGYTIKLFFLMVQLKISDNWQVLICRGCHTYYIQRCYSISIIMGKGWDKWPVNAGRLRCPWCYWLKPFTCHFFRENIKIYLHFMSFLHANKTQVVEIPPRVRQGSAYSTYQYHGCWCPGDVRSQGISNHDIDLVKRDNSVPAC